MKSKIKFAAFIFLAFAFFNSCQKKFLCPDCDTNSNKLPIPNAGADQTITLPKDSTILDGSASTDPDGTITSFKWAKIAGPASVNITMPGSSKTITKSLVAGVYRFELTVTDNSGLTAKDTVQVMVDAPGNQPPVACAGADQTITLPTNTVTLDGSCSADPENNITTYVWTKIAGASSFNITNGNTAQTQLTNLIEGTYLFELKVTDTDGLFSKDTMQVVVNPGANNFPVDIYVAGYEYAQNGHIAKYWKNGQGVPLTIGTNAFANCIVVVGSDIYVAGNEDSGSGQQVAKYWKNGQAVPLTNGSYQASANSIVVVGSDVYVAGIEASGIMISDNDGNYNTSVAKYWKNGQGVSLTEGTRHAEAKSIVVVGNDVYVAGYESNGSRYVAKYWKNGQEVPLTNGAHPASAYSIAVVGNDVYVAGSEYSGSGNVAKYWKNGQAVPLTNGSFALSIVVVGSDVYVAGGESKMSGSRVVSKYWKNGQGVLLTNGLGRAVALSIAVVDSDIYLAGWEEVISGFNSVAKYWKNGQGISLTNGIGSANATSIAVVRR